jgi:hypothetical protein
MGNKRNEGNYFTIRERAQSPPPLKEASALVWSVRGRRPLAKAVQATAGGSGHAQLSAERIIPRILTACKRSDVR